MTRAVHGFGWALKRREATQAVASVKQQLWVGFLVIVLLLSAFSVIYLKDLSRRLYIQYQQLQQVQQQKEMEWSKLLLEKGAWSTQSRVQHIATNKLDMIVPAASAVVLVEDGDQAS